MPSDAIVFVGLMPHAPILAPGVGRARHAHVNRTIDAMAHVARHAVASLPDAVLVISPYAPCGPGAFGIWRTPLLRGSFEQFGSDEDHVALPLDTVFAEQLETESVAHGLPCWRIAAGSLDHGAAVPLAYVAAAGWKGPTIVVGLNHPAVDVLDEFGQAIAATAEMLGRRLVVIASGDMSHCLTASSPSGYHPDGDRFDAAFLSALRASDPCTIRQIDPLLAGHAVEDVVAPTRIALAASGYATPHRQVLSYENPFGVGYGVAVLCDRNGQGARGVIGTTAILTHPGDLPRVARDAVLARFADGPAEPPYAAAGDLAQSRGVFVSLRKADGSPHGSHGSPVPAQRNLIWETWHCAQAAAFEDARFPALLEDELRRMQFSVSIASPLERVASTSDFDPSLHGILVTGPRNRTAFLLPGLRNVDTPAEQLRFARQKAGLRPHDSVQIQRFTIQTFQEPFPLEDGA